MENKLWYRIIIVTSYKLTQRIIYRQTSNISRTLLGKKIVDHSDVAGAAPTTSSFSTLNLASMD